MSNVIQTLIFEYFKNINYYYTKCSRNRGCPCHYNLINDHIVENKCIFCTCPQVSFKDEFCSVNRMFNNDRYLASLFYGFKSVHIKP